MTRTPNIFVDLLASLGVPHTYEYSTERFAGMSFRSLFGFTKLLSDYGVDSQGLLIYDHDELNLLTPPFLARSATGRWVIVERISHADVTYQSEGVAATTPIDTFKRAWDGYVLLAFPRPDASEPDYAAHHAVELLTESKRWVLLALVIGLWAYLFSANGIWHSWATIAVMLVDIAGLWLTYMLMQKSHGVHTRTADRVCGVIEAGGCDSILSTKAATFFGLFGWSEVGFAYFGISLAALLIFPSAWPALAACNILCLPFSFWSIWYQKYRAKAWCTLCVSVQCALWISAICWVAGGFASHIFPLGAPFWLLAATYPAALLAINLLSPYIRFDTSQ